MEKYINEPDESGWTEDDVVREYNICRDKKKVARIYCIPTKDVTEILKRKKD